MSTIIIPIIAILIAIWTSDVIRLAVKDKPNSIIANYISLMDRLLLSEPIPESTKNTVNKNYNTNLQKYFSSEFPAFRYLGLESPIHISKSEQLYIDLDGIRNIPYRNRLVLVVVSLIVIFGISGLFALIYAINMILNAKYISGLFIVSTTIILCGYSIIRLINYSKVVDQILEESKPVEILLSINKDFVFFSKGQKKIILKTSNINSFEHRLENDSDILVIIKESGENKLLEYHSSYKQKILNPINFKYLVIELNGMLKRVKSNKN